MSRRALAISTARRALCALGLLGPVLVVAACGETVVTDGTGGAGAGGAAGSGGGVPACTTTPSLGGSFGWSYTSPDGAPHDCSPDTDGFTATVTGVITTGTTATHWVIDACPPNANCVPELHTLEILTNDAIGAPPLGTVVTLDASLEHTSGPTPINCRQTLVVTNTPSWEGGANPTATDTLPWLDPIDTEDGVFQYVSTPFCVIDHPDPGCAWTEGFYTEVVSYTPIAGISTKPLLGGESDTLTVPGGGGEGVPFVARYALMSNGNCENPGSSVVWVVRSP